MLSVFSALAITAPMFVISASASVNDSSVGNPNYISYNQDFTIQTPSFAIPL